MLKKLFSFTMIAGLITFPLFANAFERPVQQRYQGQNPGQYQNRQGGRANGFTNRQPRQNQNNLLKTDGMNNHQQEQSQQQFERSRTVKRQQRMNQEQQNQNTENQSQSSTVY